MHLISIHAYVITLYMYVHMWYLFPLSCAYTVELAYLKVPGIVRTFGYRVRMLWDGVLKVEIYIVFTSDIAYTDIAYFLFVST